MFTFHSPSQQKLHTLRKHADVPAFKKRQQFVTVDLSLFLIIFPKAFEFIVRDLLYMIFIIHALTKYTITNLVTSLDFVTPVACSQRQVDAVYFNLSSLLLHALLLHKLLGT
jgi:hypothetical protein